jgi:glycosyltransferase involved in cell wall biosynthesis
MLAERVRQEILMKVSVIITVKNEQAAIVPLLESLISQTRLPDEVIIVDGGSTDDTVARIESFAQSSPVPVRLLVHPGYNISQGRNAAIQAAHGPVIASTDAGVRLAPAWLENLTTPFEDNNPPTVVSGWFVPNPQTAFEVAMGATVLPALSEIKPDRFLPSSRSVAFLKEAWEKAGGYPEWLDYCEDLIFDFRLRDLYGPFPFIPEALVHFRPRGSLRAFWRQYFNYARGDGKADLWRKRHVVRYTTYLLAAGLLATGLLYSPLLLIPLPLSAALYLWSPYRRLWASFGSLSPSTLPRTDKTGPMGRLEAVLWVPIIRLAGDLAKMAGYPIGLIWRWQHRALAEIHWRKDLLSSPGPASAGPSKLAF